MIRMDKQLCSQCHYAESITDGLCHCKPRGFHNSAELDFEWEMTGKIPTCFMRKEARQQ